MKKKICFQTGNLCLSKLLPFTFFCFVIFVSCKKNLNQFDVKQETLSQKNARQNLNLTMLSSPIDASSTFSDLTNFPINVIVKENSTGKKYLTYVGARQGYFAFGSQANDSTQIFYLRLDAAGDLQLYQSVGGGFQGLWTLGAGTDPRAGIVDTSIMMSYESNLNFTSKPMYSWRIFTGGTINDGAYLLKNVGYNKL